MMLQPFSHELFSKPFNVLLPNGEVMFVMSPHIDAQVVWMEWVQWWDTPPEILHQ